ncbi:MAG: NAD(+)/NADH kinase [Tissierellia bacterium]|nr:NAD(+)/NADH kinase [Tissierellia bacterium]
MTDILNIVSNTNYMSRNVKDYLLKQLKKYDFEASTTFSKNALATICIGGDGAFIKAVHRNNFPLVPFVGINTGHLGFYQEINPEEIDEFLRMLKNGDYIIDETLLVGAEVFVKNRRFYLNAINEIILKGQGSKIIHMDVAIDKNHLQTFSGDGIMISTPCGSTGYNYSLGGSIVYPTLHTLQITPMAPINSVAFRSLPSSIIVPGDSVISLRPEKRYENSSLVIVDGMELSYKNLQKINLRVSKKKINRLIFQKNHYWKNLKGKFL